MKMPEAYFHIVDTYNNNKIVGQVRRSSKKEERKKYSTLLMKSSQYKMYCGCRTVYFPEIQYGFRKDLDIYPLITEKQKYHSRSCPNSVMHRDSLKYNRGMTVEVVDKETITTFAVEGLPPRKPYVHSNDGGGRVGNPDVVRAQTGKLTVCSMIKNILMSEYERYSRCMRDNYIHENSLNGFMNYLRIRLQSIYIKGYDVALNSMKLDADGIEFAYGMLDRIQEYVETNGWGREINKYKLIHGERTVKINESTVMEDALNEFENTYRMSVHRCLEQGMKIFWAGFRRRYEKSSAHYIFDLHFILLSNTGMLAESSNEVKMYDYINEFINSNHLKSMGVQFFKPYIFGYSVYRCLDCDRDFLEDGIIKINGVDTEYIIEVFGMDNEAYIERKQAKEGVFDEDSVYRLIKWDVLNDPSIHVIDSMLEKVKMEAINKNQK